MRALRSWLPPRTESKRGYRRLFWPAVVASLVLHLVLFWGLRDRFMGGTLGFGSPTSWFIPQDWGETEQSPAMEVVQLREIRPKPPPPPKLRTRVPRIVEAEKVVEVEVEEEQQEVVETTDVARETSDGALPQGEPARGNPGAGLLPLVEPRAVMLSLPNPDDIPPEKRGRVKLLVHVLANGRVADVKVAKGASAEVDSLAVRHIRQTQWIPGRRNGKPADFWYPMELEIR